MSPIVNRQVGPVVVAAAFLAVAACAFLFGQRTASQSSDERPQASAKTAPDASRGTANDSLEGIVTFEPETLKLANLRIEPVGYRSLQSRLAVTGTIEPNLGSVVKITPRVAGKITEVRVNVGDSVRAGQVLAVLASTELAEAQAEYDHTRHQRTFALKNLQRQKRLASLGAFGRPRVEAARNQTTAAQAEIDTARNEVAAAQAGVAEAESALRALQAELAQAETQVQVTQSRFHRADLLLKDELISRQDWEQAQADDQRARADVEAARAKIAEGQARLETERTHLNVARAKFSAARRHGAIVSQALAREEAVYKGGYVTSKEIVEAEAANLEAMHEFEAAVTKIRLLGGTPGGGNMLTIAAPIGGRVTERSVSLGETVMPDKTLFTVINLHTVWVQLNVYQKDLPAVRVGQAVTVTSDTAPPGHRFRGRVSYIGDVLDETTRTVKVRCVIQHEGDHLKPETFVRGTIAGATRRAALVVPKDAVQEVNGKPVVFLPVGKPGAFRATPIQRGEMLDGLVAVTAGLNPGSRIVTKNAFLVKSQAMKGELAEE